MTAKTFQELRAWRTAYAFKLRIYELIDSSPIAGDERLQKQLREGAASAPSQISEGFGRFDPPDFGRFVKMARASLLECRNHLLDAVDRRHITEDTRKEHDQLAEEALKEVGGLLDYLQSPEAKRNAERIRQRREERRLRRRQTQQNSEQQNSEQRNSEQRNSEQPNGEPRTRTKNREPELGTRTRNPEPGTRNGS